MSDHVRKLGDTNKPITVTLSPETIDLTGSTILSTVADSTGAIVFSRAPTVDNMVGAKNSPPKLSTAVLVGDFTVIGEYSFETRVTFPDGSIQRFPEAGFMRILVKPHLA